MTLRVALVARMHASQLTQIGMTAFGFNAILWGWLHLVGFSEVSAEIIPFVAGCLGPVAVYTLAIRKGLGWVPGIIAALLLVVAPMDVDYSATVKQYTSEALLTVFLVWFAWTVLADPQRKNLVMLGAIACFSVVVSSMTVFAVVPIVCIPVLYTALGRKERRFDCIITVAVTVAFIGAWLPLMAGDASNPALRQFWSKFYVVRDDGLHGMAVSSLALTKQFFDGLGQGRIRFVLVVVAVIAATVLSARRRPVLTIMLWSPVALLYLASLTGRAPFGGGGSRTFFSILCWRCSRPRLSTKRSIYQGTLGPAKRG